MTTARFGFTEIGSSTSGVHALHDGFVQQVEDLIGQTLSIDIADGTTTSTPTAAQAQENAVYKYNDDGASAPATDTKLSMRLDNFPSRVFAVWNNMSVNVVSVEASGGGGFTGNAGHGVLPGHINWFFFDGTKVHNLSVSDNQRFYIEVNAVDNLASAGGSYTGAYAGQSIGGITLTRDDWVLLTDYDWVFLAASASGDVRGYHPFVGDPGADTSTPNPYNVIVKCTEGLNAGKYYLFDGSNWIEAPFALGLTDQAPIALGGFYPGTPGTSVVIWEAVVAYDMVLPDDFSGAQGFLRTGPSGGSISFDVQKNGTNIGNFDFASAATTATWSTDATMVSLSAGDRLAISTPADLRSAADLSWMIPGTRTS